MISSKKKFDTSHELCIYRYHNGIKLIRPDRIAQNTCSLMYDTGFTVNDLLKFSFNICFSNLTDRIENINEANIETIGFTSLQSALQKSVSAVVTPESAKIIINNNKNIISNNQTIFFEEKIQRRDDTKLQRLAIKSPCYDDEDNKIIGVLSCTIVYSIQSLPNALLNISQLGILKSNAALFEAENFLSKKRINNIHLSKKESEVAYYLIRGKTAKGIAQMLKISQRTVEQYLENIKIKIGAYTKPDLIEKIIDYFT